jgi:predicted PolB exonuclease-like 3'-5' exonuclease
MFRAVARIRDIPDIGLVRTEFGIMSNHEEIAQKLVFDFVRLAIE